MSEQIELIHEVYIDENSIDESTLPENIQTKIGEIDVVIDMYNEMGEDDEQLADVEAQIEAKSKVLKALIETFYTSKKEEVKTEKVVIEPVKPIAEETPKEVVKEVVKETKPTETPKTPEVKEVVVEKKEEETPKEDDDDNIFCWMDV